MYAMRELVAPVLDELGAPPGTLNILCGDPAPMLNAWVDSPHVDDIMYFGSSENGLRFESRCVAAGKKPILELAGNDLVIIWKDADLDYAAEALTEAFYGSGQLCSGLYQDQHHQRRWPVLQLCRRNQEVQGPELQSEHLLV